MTKAHSQTGEDQLISELAQISAPEDRLRFLRGNKQLRRASFVDKAYHEVVRLTRADLQQADNLAQAIVWIARKLNDEGCRAQALRATGHVLLSSAKYGDALKHYRGALNRFRRLERDIDVGRTLSGGSLQALIYLGRYDQAFAWALEAREIFERHGDRLRLARLDSNMGNILYRQDRLEEALEYYRHAHEEFCRQGEPQDVAITLRNMAVCYISLGDFQKALDTYQAAREHCQRQGMSVMVAEVDYNIAYLYYQRGEYSRAIELYQSTRQHCDKLGDPYHKALCDLDQSEMYLELNLSGEGAQLARRAAASFRALGMRYEEAKSLTNLAVAASHQGNAARALRIFRKARNLFALEKNQVWPALLDLYRALVLFQQGQDSASLALCLSALGFFSRSLLEGKAALSELLRARLHLRAHETREALRTCQAALERLKNSEAPYIQYQAYFVLGQIHEARQDKEAATASYREAHATLENLRSRLTGEELRIAFLKDKLAIYESLVWLTLSGKPSLEHKETAFAYIEQAKSRSLADQIATRYHYPSMQTRTHGSLAEKAQTLRDELNWYYKQIERDDLGNERRSASRGNLRQRMRECENKLSKALADLRALDKGFSVLQNAGTVELDSIRSAIPANGVLLEYYQVREMLHACILRPQSLEIVPLAPVSRVRNLFRLLRFQLSKFRLGQDYVRAFSRPLRAAVETHLRELYSELIAPVRYLLTAEHMVVVPHDFLHYLPFQALFDGQNYLIDEVPISYAPSASVYYYCCSNQANSQERSLVLGIPDVSAPNILNEVRNVASELPNAVLCIGREATEENLRRHGPGSRYVHIAAHGLFRQDNPMFSSMRLGDSSLTLMDLYSLNLSAELVTLSGCSTGMNAIVGGDELLGLVRGLLYAGTRAVLVTLWEVDDRSTAEFMKSFYSQLRSASNKAVALQKAMQEVRERYRHPYYWAPFVLVGRSTPVQGNFAGRY